MNYWHMQLEPSDNKKGVSEVIKILNHNLIGMGKWDEKASQQDDFKNKMKIGDIVLIKSGRIAIAMVRVTSNYFEESEDDNIWFDRRRGIEVLEILESPRDDFPQPLGTLNFCNFNNKNPTNDYIYNWYKKLKKEKAQFNLSEIYNIHIEFTKMKESNKVSLFNIINNIKKSDIRQLSYIYKSYTNIENKPVVNLRRLIIDKLLIGDINEDIINNLKANISLNSTKNVFKSWSDPFRILYSIYYAKYKLKIEKYFERFIRIVQKRLDLENKTKYTFVHFDGAQNQGSDNLWFVIYNNSYKSQVSALQLSFKMEKGKYIYGLFSNIDSSICDLSESDTFEFDKLINKFNKYKNKILKDHFMDQSNVVEISGLLTNTEQPLKQIILQGPPGTGKTRLARFIARYLVKGEFGSDIEDIADHVTLIQFHPSYSYEDFVRGIVSKTIGNSIEYSTQDKILIKIANKAIQNPLKKYILIIDEINRANLSSVLGELIYALEYRGQSVDSMYEIDGERKIVLPDNLFIIGTMNTADRSIGHIDYAIRRRFIFINILSNIEILNDTPNGKSLYEKVTKLFSKEYVSPEFSVENILIGHSYFIADDDNIELLQLNFEYKIKPLIKEYINDGILSEDVIALLEEIKIEESY